MDVLILGIDVILEYHTILRLDTNIFGVYFCAMSWYTISVFVKHLEFLLVCVLMEFYDGSDEIINNIPRTHSAGHYSTTRYGCNVF